MADTDVEDAVAARLLTPAALACAVVAAGWVLLSGAAPYAVEARLINAGQLVEGNQVRIGAVTVGTVERLRLDDDGVARIRLEIDDDHAPLPQGTVARVRLNSLSGVANRYVSLDVPPSTGRTKTIPDGGRLETDRTQAPADLDAVIATFDAPTRAGLRELIAGGARHLDGRAGAAGTSLDRLEPALSGLTGVARELARDEAALTALLTRGAAATGALAGQRAEVTDLVTHAEATARAVAGEDDAFGTALERLPATLSSATETFDELRGSLGALERLTGTALPATRRLGPFAADLARLTEDAAQPVARLGDLVRQPGAADDLTDVAAAAPALATTAQDAFPRAIRTMDRATGQVGTLRQYTPDLVATLSRLGQVSAGYDANGHYARVQPAFFGFRYDAVSNRIEADARDRLARVLDGQVARCPGGVTQASGDGSAPWPVAGCRLSSTPPAR